MYDYTEDRLVPKLKPAFESNVEGPFYVSDQCILCAAPVEAAPDNVKWHYSADCDTCPRSCFIAKQPTNDSELDQTIAAMLLSCVENIRYCGTNEEILRRLEQAGSGRLCDALPHLDTRAE